MLLLSQLLLLTIHFRTPCCCYNYKTSFSWNNQGIGKCEFSSSTKAHCLLMFSSMVVGVNISKNDIISYTELTKSASSFPDSQKSLV